MPETVARKLMTGERSAGSGRLAGRLRPEATNPITQDFSVALFAYGLLDQREYDSFGLGFYYNKISNNLKSSIAAISQRQAAAHDESGMEVFYNLALTPAVRLIPSYQHIWYPLAAEVAVRQDSADIFQLRLTTAW